MRLAVVTMLTGKAAGPFGVPARNAAELLVEAVNGGGLPPPYATPGFAGRRAVLTVHDEAGGAEEQRTLFRRLHEEGIDAVVGYAGSTGALAVAPLSQALRQLTVVFNAGTLRLFDGERRDWMFRTASTTAGDAIGAARYAAATMPPGVRFGGINPGDAWGTDSWAGFREAFSILRPDAVEVGAHFFPLLSEAVEAPLQALVAAGVDLVHSSNWGGDLFRLVSAVGGRSSPRLLLVSGESGLRRLAPHLPDGVIVGARGAHGRLARETPLRRWFVDAYRDRFEVAPIYPAYGMANALLCLKAAWDLAGAEADPAAVRSALEGLAVEGVGTRLRLAAAGGHQAIAETAYVQVCRRTDGSFELHDLRYFPAQSVYPPDGASPAAWLAGG